MVFLFHTTSISVDLAHHKIACAKAGKGGIKHDNGFVHYILGSDWTAHETGWLTFAFVGWVCDGDNGHELVLL